MPCDRSLKRNQTIQQRATELKTAAKAISTGISKKEYKIKISPTGAIAFSGIPEDIRDGATDACIYRRLIAEANPTVLAELAKAETLAGRTINKSTLSAGIHSHDGGTTWHNGH